MGLEIGDGIVITGFTENSCTEDITLGKKYIIVDVGDDNDIGSTFVDDDGDERLIQYFKYNVCENSLRRPHADLIIDWANGAIIQYCSERSDEDWRDVADNKPKWFDDTKYRVKPPARVEYDDKSYIKSEFEDAIKDLESEPVVSVTESKFIVGAEVKISETSSYYSIDDDDPEYNPKDTVGKITRLYNPFGLPIGVKWPNGFTNAYNKEDLYLV